MEHEELLLDLRPPGAKAGLCLLLVLHDKHMHVT